ncbi:septum formation inhibitor Maf [Eudoraea chungangensis]|uniref:septum formation inhibitor Maf n=1 Tax=Eudoraea chungangensis TaxID=1481905 RepID=UPI0023EB0FC2|nr:septum formation inhibitor Maf [Eudoraea chungangensis]
MRYHITSIAFSLGLSLLIISCQEIPKEKTDHSSSPKETTSSKSPTEKRELSKEFKSYWYAGKAEITSYTLQQVRYGELRQGTSALIYVTEPFLEDKQVKADDSHSNNIPVLKLNSTKKYLTGIYPYSIMTSSFFPVKNVQHALKVSTSVQEWCGHVYAQLNNKEEYEIMSHSYFAREADQQIRLKKDHLENEIWNLIRISPENLPIGELNMIPSLEYLRTAHREIKSYAAVASLEVVNDLKTYTIHYPELERTLSIHFTNAFPFHIEGWEEETNSGYGNNKQKMLSTGKMLRRIKSAYWQQNSNADLIYRDSLGL